MALRNWILLCSVLLVALPALPQDAESELQIKEVEIGDSEPIAEEACFDVRSIRGFDAIDDRHVLVNARRDEYYLLTMSAFCPGLRNSLSIAISNIFSRVCSNSAATVSYRDFGRTEECRIRRVEAVEGREGAELLIEGRRESN